MVYEVILRGVPEEYGCIVRLREALVSLGATCVGHQAMQLCGYGDVLVKLTPFAERAAPYPQVLREPALAPQLCLVIEGSRPCDVVRVAEIAYKLFRECGVALRLVA